MMKYDNFDAEERAYAYYLESLPSDVGISFRVPKELRDEFNRINKGALSTILKSFMIDYVLYNRQQSKHQEQTIITDSQKRGG